MTRNKEIVRSFLRYYLLYMKPKNGCQEYSEVEDFLDWAAKREGLTYDIRKNTVSSV